MVSLLPVVNVVILVLPVVNVVTLASLIPVVTCYSG